MIKNKNLFKNMSIFLCLIPMLILSIFCLVPRNDYDIHAVDTTSAFDGSFVGSNIIVPVMSFHEQSNHQVVFDRVAFASLTFGFSHSNGRYYYSIDGFASPTSLNSQNLTAVNFEPFNTYITGLNFPQRLLFDVTSNDPWFVEVVIESSGVIYFNSINRVVFSSEVIDGDLYNFITYYDTSMNFVRFGLYYDLPSNTTTYNFYAKFAFTERTYYTILNFTDNTYYDVGYQNGYLDGVASGENTGYQDGYNAGYDVGHIDGYNAGVDYGTGYSFSSLFGAVIDVPVNTFKSLMNFELLGVNLLGLFTGLLSVAIIVFIIKLCMGGK